MKRFLFCLILMAAVGTGCVRNNNPAWLPTEGKTFDFGSDSTIMAVARANIDQGVYTSDMPGLMADLLKKRLSERNIHTEGIFTYAAHSPMKSEAYDDFRRKKRKGLIEVIFHLSRQDPSMHYILISASYRPNNETQAAKIEELFYGPFLLKAQYSDSESQYIGIQEELTPIFDEALDKYFLTVKNLSMNP